MQEAAKRAKLAVGAERPHSFLSSHAQDALSAALSLSHLPDLSVVEGSNFAFSGLVVAEAVVPLPLGPHFGFFAAPPTGTPVTFLDQKMVETDLQKTAFAAVQKLFNVCTNVFPSVWGVWNTADAFRLPADLVEDTMAILILVPPNYSRGLDESSLTLSHDTRPTKTVVTNQSSLLGHVFATSSGDGELTYGGPASLAVVVRLAQPTKGPRILHTLTTDSVQRFKMAVTILRDHFFRHGPDVACVFSITMEEANNLSVLFNALAKKTHSTDVQAFIAHRVIPDGDYAFLSPPFGLESLRIQNFPEQSVLLHTCSNSYVVGVLGKKFLLRSKVRMTAPALAFQKKCGRIIPEMFSNWDQRDIFHRLGFPFDPESAAPAHLARFDEFLLESFRDERLRKDVLNQWNAVFPRYALHPSYIQTLRQFLAIDSGTQTQKFFFEALVSWSAIRHPSLPLFPFSESVYTNSRWFENTLALVHNHEICDLFWAAAKSCIVDFGCNQPFFLHAIDNEQQESVDPATFFQSLLCDAQVTKCRVCLECIADFTNSLLVHHHVRPSLLTKDTVDTLEIRDSLGEMWPEIRDALLSSERPFIKPIYPKFRTKANAERLANTAKANLQNHSLGYASLGGKARQWYVEVTLTGTLANANAVKRWEQKACMTSSFMKQLATFHGTVVSRAAVRLILLARWFAPQQMSFRSGLVPKEIWVYILKLVWASSHTPSHLWSEFEARLAKLQ